MRFDVALNAGILVFREAKIMRMEVVDNQGIANMAGELKRYLDNFDTARLATASLTRHGVQVIEDAVFEGRKSLTIRLLVGLYNGHTEPAALRRLLRLQRSFPRSIEVRIAQNPRFHWKLYLFMGKAKATAYVGSSNLTQDGLSTEGEFNLRLTGLARSRPFPDITEAFDRNWCRDSVPLNVYIAEHFASVAQRRNTRRIDAKIKEFLRPVLRHRSSPRKQPKATSTMTFFDAFAGQPTKTAVKNKTKWEDKGWQWLVFHARADRDKLRQVGAFYLAELRKDGGSLSLNDVCDDDDFDTKDGRYLVAFQRRKGSISKKLDRATLALLRRQGVIGKKDDLQRNRRLRKEHREFMNRLLKVPPLPPE